MFILQHFPPPVHYTAESGNLIEYLASSLVVFPFATRNETVMERRSMWSSSVPAWPGRKFTTKTRCGVRHIDQRNTHKKNGKGQERDALSKISNKTNTHIMQVLSTRLNKTNSHIIQANEYIKRKKIHAFVFSHAWPSWKFITKAL